MAMKAVLTTDEAGMGLVSTRRPDRRRPKHEAIASALREEISFGRLSVGGRLESEGQLCRRFRSSRGPVRQALATLEQESLIYRVKGAGSFVSEWSGQHPGTRLRRIKVIMGFGANTPGIGAEMLAGLNQAAKESDEKILLSYEFNFSHFDRFLKASTSQIFAECDGLLVLPASAEEMEMTRRLSQHAVPMVICFRHIEEARAPQVFVDQDEGARRATEYLLRYGHRRIGLLTALGENHQPRYDSAHRLSGYREAHAQAGVAVDSSLLIESSWSMSGVDKAVSRWLTASPRPSALMIGGMMLLPPALAAIHRLNVRIPDDLSLIAFDDSPETRFHSPPLTVVSQRLDRAAHHALRLLLDRIHHGQNDASNLSLKPELIIRDSCQPAPKNARVP